MSKPYTSYRAGEIVEITTPTSDKGLRKPLLIMLSKPPVEANGMWIAEGHRYLGKKNGWGFIRRWIATTITSRPFAG